MLSLLAMGCTTDLTVWRYEPDSYPVVDEALTRSRVVVLPFKDSRADGNTTADFLALIPLMPYGWTDLSLPEAAGWSFTKIFQARKFRPKEDFARGAAEELRASGIFKEVIFSRSPSGGDVVLYGEVTSTRYRRTITAYGLGPLGVFLWILGIPAAMVTNDLAIEFHLDDRMTGEVLWYKSYDDSCKKTHSAYNDARPFNYDTLYKGMLRDVVKELKAHFSE